jgi:hypothetical protein
LIGSLTTFCERWTCLNTGDSSTRSRTHSATPIIRKPNRNGTRQPQAYSASSGSRATSRNDSVPSTSPICTPVWANEQKNPRRSFGACSASSVEAPPNSAPAPSPCSTRSVTSRIGAQMPMLA